MLAIVIPYYNFQFFERTLSSLSSQTDKRFNLYIGDDDSKVNPKEILAKYSSQVKIRYKKFSSNLGGISLVKQWQRCIELINDEEWIMVLGDDDTLALNCVEEFYKKLDIIYNSNCNVIRFASQYIDENDYSLKGYLPYFHPVIEKSTDAFFRNYSQQSRSSLSEHIFKRESFEKHHFYDYPLAWHSDDRAWLEFTNYENIYTINEALVSVRVSSNSITGKKDNTSKKNFARLLFFEYLINKALPNFKNSQKAALLLEYGALLNKYNRLKLKEAFKIGISLIGIWKFISLMKFVRRFFKSKFKKWKILCSLKYP